MTDLSEAYREAMSHWPSGVAIVTSLEQNQHYGMTVSSFTSVSLYPPMISVCIDKRAQMCALLERTQKFAVSILDHTQVELAKAFANHHLDMNARFEQAEFDMSETESPVLSSCIAWVDCHVHSFHDTGDHIIYVGEVRRAKTLDSKDPVIFYRRGWHMIGN